MPGQFCYVLDIRYKTVLIMMMMVDDDEEISIFLWKPQKNSLAFTTVSTSVLCTVPFNYKYNNNRSFYYFHLPWRFTKGEVFSFTSSSDMELDYKIIKSSYKYERFKLDVPSKQFNQGPHLGVNFYIKVWQERLENLSSAGFHFVISGHVWIKYCKSFPHRPQDIDIWHIDKDLWGNMKIFKRNIWRQKFTYYYHPRT